MTNAAEERYSSEDKLLDWKRVCQVFDNPKVHKRHPGWKEVLDTCAVFDFRGHDYEKLQEKVHISEDAQELMAPLPFPKIAIVHDWQVYVLDLFWLSKEADIVAGNILAIMCPFSEHRHAYEVVISGYVEVDISEDASKTKAKSTMSDVHYTSVINGNPIYLTNDGDPDDLRALRVNEEDPNSSKAHDVLPGLFMNVITFLSYINAPTRFIVKQIPKKMGKAKKGQIPRLYQRPQYIILDKQNIKTRYLNSQPKGHKSPMPHLRRGHYRTLTSEKYRRKKGQRVWVRATHVKGNEIEWREGDRYYEVI